MKKSLLFIKISGAGIIIFFSVILSACSGAPEKKSNDQIEPASSNNQLISKSPSSYTDTLTITSASAVIYNSDSLQLEKIKAINKEMIFESMVHDCFYQMRNSRMVLKKYWPLVKIIDTSKARYLLFIKADKGKIYIDLDTKNDICGLFLFDGKKDPVLADMTNIDTALRFYFNE